MLRRRFQRPGPFSIWPVWKSMCHKVRVHALRDADNPQPIVPFYEVDNLHSVSFRLVPVPPRLRRLVCRPIHSSTPLPDRTVPNEPVFQAQISIPLLIPFHQIVDHLPKRWCAVSVLRKKASPNIWPTYCRGIPTTMQVSGENPRHSRRSPHDLRALRQWFEAHRRISTRSAGTSNGSDPDDEDEVKAPLPKDLESHPPTRGDRLKASATSS